MSQQIIKVKFMRQGVATGRAYSYYADESIQTGDKVYLPLSAYSDPSDGYSKGFVIATGVPEEEVQSFKDAMRSIIGKVEEDKPEPQPEEEQTVNNKIGGETSDEDTDWFFD